MRVITDRSARLRCGAIVKMCMERDLLYRYFDGDTTPDEERRIMEWAEASPENYRSLPRRAAVVVRIVAPCRTTDGAPSRALATVGGMACERCGGLHPAAGRPCGNLLRGRMFPDERMQQVVVPAGQRVELRLADGTKVWLNSKSRLSIRRRSDGVRVG